MTKKFLALVMVLAIATSFCLIFTPAGFVYSAESVSQDTESSTTSYNGDPKNWCGTCAASDTSLNGQNIEANDGVNPTPTPPEPDGYVEVITSGTYGDFDYEIRTIYVSDGKIVKYNGDSQTVEIPEYIRDQSSGTVPVMYITKGSFKNCTSMVNLIIPYNVDWIESKAFENCANLETVYIPSGIKSIASDAFAGCDDIKTVYFGGTAERFATLTDNGESCPELLNAEIIYSDNPQFYVYLEPEAGASDFLLTLENGATGVSFVTQGETSVENSTFGTGMSFEIYCDNPYITGNIKTYDFTVIMYGDVNGDGKVTTTDYLRVKKSIVEPELLSGEFFMAADINGDGVIRSTDYLRIKKTFGS